MRAAAAEATSWTFQTMAYIPDRVPESKAGAGTESSTPPRRGSRWARRPSATSARTQTTGAQNGRRRRRSSTTYARYSDLNGQMSNRSRSPPSRTLDVGGGPSTRRIQPRCCHLDGLRASTRCCSPRRPSQVTLPPRARRRHTPRSNARTILVAVMVIERAPLAPRAWAEAESPRTIRRSPSAVGAARRPTARPRRPDGPPGRTAVTRSDGRPPRSTPRRSSCTPMAAVVASADASRRRRRSCRRRRRRCRRGRRRPVGPVGRGVRCRRGGVPQRADGGGGGRADGGLDPGDRHDAKQAGGGGRRCGGGDGDRRWRSWASRRRRSAT